ncbi:MAG: helix-turn-helix transcriptional regulator [Thermodesulfovibrionales bacterium]
MENIHFISLNNCLRKYRRARGFKQKDVARILGLRGTSMISRWEKGGCLPDSLNILRLSILYRTM